MNGFKIDIDEFDNNCIYNCSRKVITQIIKDEDEATYKAILRYCEKNDIIPNIISEDKLKLILQLGIDEYNKRELNKEKI